MTELDFSDTFEIKYYGEYNSGSGDYEGFYMSNVWPDYDSIPTPNIELTESQWKEARQNRQTRFRVIDGIHTEVPFTTDEENEKILGGMIAKRLSLLSQSDWVVLPHSPITGSKLDEWIQYRQDLRDITSQTPPYTLPTKPE
jgi:hypothetical protein|tara:strand:- start:301 stop:726 length:426 start_codon:yes stop_codon:yes gene_type:complete